MNSILQKGAIVQDRYTVIDVVDNSQSYIAYRVEDQQQCDQLCMLKCFLNNTLSNDAQLIALTSQLKNLNHNQIEKLYHFFIEGEYICFVFNYIEGSSYQEKYIDSRLRVSESEIISFLQSVLNPLQFLRQNNTYHGNICPQNIILRSFDNLPILTNLGIFLEIANDISINHQKKLIDQVREFTTPNINSPFEEDLYTLGLTTIMLLTAQRDPSNLFDTSLNIWDWEDYILLNNRLDVVIKKMLKTEPYSGYQNIDQVLHDLSSTDFSTTISHPTEIQKEISSQTLATPVTPQEIKFAVPTTDNPLPIYDTSVNGSTVNSSTVQQTIPDKDISKKDIIIGGTIGFIILIVLLLVNELGNFRFSSDNSITSNPPNNNVTQGQNNIGNNQENTRPPQTATFSQQEAKNLIQRWLDSKGQIFGPPYNKNLASSLLTGTQYNNTVSRSDGDSSAIDWLRNNNAYYTYSNQSIDGVENFTLNGNVATIDALITESRTLYNARGGIDRSSSGYDQRLVRYQLSLVNGQWKINDYDTLEVKWRR